MIDTPVSRISDKQREKFAEVLGEVGTDKQVLLLFTPSEYSPEVSKVLDNLANTKYEMNDPAALFWDEYLTDTYSIFNLLFSKELIRKNHCFSIGTGLLFRNFNHQDINYQITPVYNADNELVDVEIGFPYPYNLNMNDLGVVFDLEYYYRLNNRISLGISCSTNLIFDIGFETLSISPLIRCSF